MDETLAVFFHEFSLTHTPVSFRATGVPCLSLTLSLANQAHFRQTRLGVILQIGSFVMDLFELVFNNLQEFFQTPQHHIEQETPHKGRHPQGSCK